MASFLARKNSVLILVEAKYVHFSLAVSPKALYKTTTTSYLMAVGHLLVVYSLLSKNPLAAPTPEIGLERATQLSRPIAELWLATSFSHMTCLQITVSATSGLSENQSQTANKEPTVSFQFLS